MVEAQLRQIRIYLTLLDENTILILMCTIRNKIGLFMRGLAVSVLALPLVLMPLNGTACETSCMPEGLSNIHHCFLNVSALVLPDLPISSCCVNELLQAEPYVSSRQKSEKRKAPPLRVAAVTIPWDTTAPLALGPGRSGSLAVSTQLGAAPLYKLHSIFLI